MNKLLTTEKSQQEDLLTPSQFRYLSTIHVLTGTLGYPPRMTEIGRALGIASTNAVSQAVAVLIRKGFLNKTPMQARSITLTEEGLEALE